MNKGILRNVIVMGLIVAALAQATPALADATIVNTIKETTDSKSGVKTVTEIQELSDGSIKEIKTQSDGYVVEDTYYSDGSGIGKIYQDGVIRQFIFTEIIQNKAN